MCLTKHVYHMVATLVLTNYGGVSVSSQTLWFLTTTHYGDRKSRRNGRHLQSEGNILNIRFLPFKKKLMLDLSWIFFQTLVIRSYTFLFKRDVLDCSSLGYF